MMCSPGSSGTITKPKSALASESVMQDAVTAAVESNDPLNEDHAAENFGADRAADPFEHTVRVLIAEDNPADVRLIGEALQHHSIAAELVVQTDGEAMLAYVTRIEAGEAECPDIILLDLNLPRKSGHIVLARLRESPSCGRVPVIVVTSSNAPRDRDLAARFGADSYFRKPIDYDEFLLLGALVRQILTHRSSV